MFLMFAKCSFLFWKINILLSSKGGREENPWAEAICKWADGRKVILKKRENDHQSGWQDGLLFQVWSPWVPPHNPAMSRPPQCRRGLRRSFCGKNSRTGGLWAGLGWDPGAWAWDCKQQQQEENWDQPAPAPAFPVKAAVMRFQAAWDCEQQNCCCCCQGCCESVWIRAMSDCQMRWRGQTLSFRE